jgi:hypothetical protein
MIFTTEAQSFHNRINRIFKINIYVMEKIIDKKIMFILSIL